MRSAPFGRQKPTCTPGPTPHARNPAAAPRAACHSCSYVSTRPSASVSWSSSRTAAREPKRGRLRSSSHHAGAAGYGSECGTCAGHTPCQGRAPLDAGAVTSDEGDDGGQRVAGVHGLEVLLVEARDHFGHRLLHRLVVETGQPREGAEHDHV